MYKYFSNYKGIFFLNIGIMSVLVIFVLSCNKSFPDKLTDKNTEPQHNALQHKVLLIMIDGAVGNEIVAIDKKIRPNLNELADYSIYSTSAINEFADINMTSPLCWTTVLTGVTSDKHNVTGAGFAGNKLAEYPSIFTRLANRNMRTVAYCSSPDLVENLAKDATEKQLFVDNDEAVKNAAKAELSAKNPNLVLAQFNSVDKAGMTSGYSHNAPQYVDAIKKIDTYLGELVTAIKNRNTYKEEDWTIIIISGKGSNTGYTPSGAAWSAFDDPRHNTLFLYYNPRFKSVNMDKPTVFPYQGLAPLFTTGEGSEKRNAKLTDGGVVGNLGATGDLTIQCKVKFPTDGASWPPFLSKIVMTTRPGYKGWCFIREGNIWKADIEDGGGGHREIPGAAINDNLWHTLTMVIKQEGAARKLYSYTDGASHSASGVDFASYGNLDNNAPLTLGYNPTAWYGGALNDFFVTDVRIYNTALPADYIGSAYCQTSVAANDPYISNLVGFWPCTSVGADNTIPDMSGHGNNLQLNKPKFNSFNDVTEKVCPAISPEAYRLVPNAADATLLIYKWLNVKVEPSWQLDGKIWVPEFIDVGRNK